MAAFPTMPEPSYSTSMVNEKGAFIHKLNVVRQMWTSPWVLIRVKFENLSSTDYGTLRTFLVGSGRTTVVTWTIDGIDYSGLIFGGFRVTWEGPTYTVSFSYIAEEV